MGCGRGIALIERDRWVVIDALPHWVGRLLLNVGTLRDGRLWVTSNKGLYFSTGDDTFEGIAEGVLGNGISFSVSQDRSAHVWVGDWPFGLVELTPRPRRYAAVPGGSYRLLHDRNGDLWVGTNTDGLWRLRVRADGTLQAETAILRGETLNPAVSALLEDREGNLWVGTTAGLHRLAPERVPSLTAGGTVNVLESSARPHVAWAGTPKGLAQVSCSDTDLRVVRADGLSGPVNGLALDTGGTLWLTLRGDGALGRFADRRFERVTIPASLRLGTLRYVTSDHRGGNLVRRRCNGGSLERRPLFPVDPAGYGWNHDASVRLPRSGVAACGSSGQRDRDRHARREWRSRWFPSPQATGHLCGSTRSQKARPEACTRLRVLASHDCGPDRWCRSPPPTGFREVRPGRSPLTARIRSGSTWTRASCGFHRSSSTKSRGTRSPCQPRRVRRNRWTDRWAGAVHRRRGTRGRLCVVFQSRVAYARESVTTAWRVGSAGADCDRLGPG